MTGMPLDTALARITAWAAGLPTRLALFAVNAPAALGAYRRHVDIAFGPDATHSLDVYEPLRPAGSARPLIVFWHGGRWSAGRKSDYRFVGAALAELGYVAVIANYRHYPEVRMPGFVADAALALAWAAAHARDFGADPARLVAMGHSSGAHMAALVTLDRRYLQALGAGALRVAGVIGLSGPYDFLPLREADVQDMFGPPPLYPESQPVNYVRDDAPPMLLIHGLRDRMVSPENSRRLAAALAARGVPVTLELYDVGHADTVAALSLPARRRAATLEHIAAFVGTLGAQAAFDAASAGAA
jgi:acetyl esterase/lipase